jgi:uncharacterized protein (UPF0264 family)
MPDLLVSVRSSDEAEAALVGGADVIDVKEPARGSLGRADDVTIAEVLRVVAGRRPVSAALSELGDFFEPPPLGLAFAKWGLARLEGHRWQARLHEAANVTRAAPVAVAYADHDLAQSPPPLAVADFAIMQHWPVFLIDTLRKNGRTLLDWLNLEELRMLCERCRRGGVRVALAGSLGVEQIERLRELEPDWFAVRSAACVDGRRDQRICADRVRALAGQLRPTPIHSDH